MRALASLTVAALAVIFYGRVIEAAIAYPFLRHSLPAQRAAVLAAIREEAR